ncbi:MAG: hypothetical protein ACD_3C00044G0002 [uncultured bacterium (gcode 4)]|uniref:Uncharacterized protein n=1 Tax=uncultured bacterium (gcode 4) TaxID=1234023 RepID=K2GYP9_9BACT|nr:MAG: hypothetical protein ACD_3C00044G0002 [uncultured bacterium (gcode 4)]
MFRTKNNFRSEPLNWRSAFTLVELIVVIVILAILATIAFLSFSSQSGSARDSTRLSDISSIKKWMEMYNVNSWFYPAPDNSVEFTYSGWRIWNQWTLWDAAYKLIQKTLSKKVKDPLKDSEYDYSLASNKREYQVAWNLENPTSLQMNYNPFDSSALSSQLSALGWTWTNVYISGNYNWVVLKVTTWSLNYFVPAPTLFWINPSNQTSLSYDNTFSSWKIILSWVNNFANFKSDSVYSTWWTELSSTDIVNLMSKIQLAYSGSNIDTPFIQTLNSATGSALIDLWSWLIKNSLWGSSSSSSTQEPAGSTEWPVVVLTWSTESNPWTSCGNIKSMLPSSADWAYWVKPDSNAANQVFCDMTTDWGWWTLALWINTSDWNNVNYENDNFWSSDTFSMWNNSSPYATDYKNAKVFFWYANWTKLLVKITNTSNNLVAWRSYNLQWANTTLWTYFNAWNWIELTNSVVSNYWIASLDSREPIIYPWNNLLVNTRRWWPWYDLDRISIWWTPTINYWWWLWTWYDYSVNRQRPRADWQLLNCWWASDEACRIWSDYDSANANAWWNLWSGINYNYTIFIK